MMKWVKGVKGHKLLVINEISPRKCQTQHGDDGQQHCIVYLDVAKTVNLKSSHYKKRTVFKCADGY